ncbi:MAG: hypothetical protein PUA68_00665 [Bacilli bacterium]|nr:hypothetical protein [Bacilli bacterium]
MENVFPSNLVELLTISVAFSFIIMSLIQKLKKITIINKDIHIIILNLIFSFALSVPFVKYFYNLTTYDGLWVGLFTFIGAPTLYKVFKNQKVITYHPESLNDTITIPISKEIKYDK